MRKNQYKNMAQAIRLVANNIPLRKSFTLELKQPL